MSSSRTGPKSATGGGNWKVSSGAAASPSSPSPRPGAAAVEDSAAAPDAREPEPPATAGTLREFKDQAERAYLVQKLRENGWNISKTAEVIDTPRSNLYKKLEQYRISQETDG